MENLLIMGIDTRPVVNSSLKLNYKTTSISYFKDLDFKEPFDERHVLNQEKNNSYGNFEDNYSPLKLLNLLENYISRDNLDSDYFDKIILTTGISAEDFKGEFSKFKTKILGNLKTKHVNDKFKFYNKIKNKFNVPLTFKMKYLDELEEIIKQYDKNSFILKPLNGSGGLGFLKLNNNSINQSKHIENINENSNQNIKNFLEKISLKDYILQEFIEGTNVSSSVLSRKKDACNLINTRLITENDLGNIGNFAYSGNIVPLDINSFYFKNPIANDNYGYSGNKRFTNKEIDKLNKVMKGLSEDLIKELKLIGSNGVDFILNNNNSFFNNDTLQNLEDNLKIIEVNPRFQGTYEICEKALGINLLDAHIKACEGQLINIPEVKQYSVKKIIYAQNKVSIGNLRGKNLYDIPHYGEIIEKNNPITTLISSNKNLEIAINDIKTAEKEVNLNTKDLI